MCGISGLLDMSRRSGNLALQSIALGMVNTLRHRGPDDVGTWADAEVGIALAHRRLSILDLSPDGHQPMRSACGRYVISFNGEVYNFKALRAELEGWGYIFRGHSDTEVMLACMSHWGVLRAVKRFNGMFAFAVWDRQERLLHLCRDRMGEKPLYYGWAGKCFIFGSELKAFRAHPQFIPELDRDAIVQYLRCNYVPAPYSIYKGVRKVIPGAFLTIGLEDSIGGAPKEVAYWSLQEAFEKGMSDPFRGSESDALAHLDGLLKDAVKLRMESDVPLGAFLSGGVDSSTIVALMQAQSATPVQTFTVGFHEAAYNEAHEAKAVASYLGTRHTEIYVTPEETMAVIPKLPALYDEPFADPCQVPTFLIAELARRDVTVTLSGDAGDELFAGYDRYLMGLRIWRKIGWMPSVARTAMAKAITTASPRSWEGVFRMLSSFLPAYLQQKNPGHKMHQLAEMLQAGSPEAIYRIMTALWKDPGSMVIGGAKPSSEAREFSMVSTMAEFANHMMHVDMGSYLPDDILVKVDRASMGVSLESRVPLLDHRLVEFAWQLPLSMKIRHGRGKWILRELLYQHVPRTLIDRPKRGFGVPIDDWIRGPLKEWAVALLDEKKLRDQGILDWVPIHAKWNEHLAGRADWQFPLWNILMFQAWLEQEEPSF